jgi:23S rRNA (adenine2030-N6)-methyltransferase
MAYSMCPPSPRRGLLLIDPSYEVKDDYVAMPNHLAKIAKIWPVGVLMLWYPILTDARHRTMKSAILRSLPDAFNHEVYFEPAREGHRMVGSGLVVVNAPWGLDDELANLTNHFAKL